MISADIRLPAWGRASLILAILALVLAVAPGAEAAGKVNKSLFGDVAIEGYDAVAYFEDDKPVEGSKDFTFEWMDATWRFASAEHRDLFEADPEKYAPQYGGYCAYAVSQGSTAGIDPEAWSIVDGKLYLNYNQKIQKKWEADRDAFIEAADENWPKLNEE
ncbi:MAG: YHS domain-containing (seleno)protein [Acidobacteriota bacterium]|nr:YHS domain-containing (seleno)protein [Acidobacteriota bacterium]